MIVFVVQLLMCGMGTYSLADFKIHHTVSAPSPSFNKVRPSRHISPRLELELVLTI